MFLTPTVLVVLVLVLVVVGLVAGTFGALLGLGGSILLVPLLTLAGFPMATAVGTGLLCVVATSCAAASVYVERGWADVRLGMLLELTTVLGAISGALVVALLSETLLKGLFGAFLLYAAVLLWRRPPADDQEVREKLPDYRVRNRALGAGVCYGVGSVSAMLGIGGGPIQVPLMYLAMGVPLKMAAATSSFLMGMTAAAGALIYYARGHVIVALTAPLVVGVFLGAQLGSRLAHRVHSRFVHLLLILVLLVLAAMMFAKAFSFTLF